MRTPINLTSIGQKHPLNRALLTVVILLCTVACEQIPNDFQSLANEHLSKIEGAIVVPGLKAEVEVIRDSWGVPHIYADDLDDLFLAQGFIQAQDRLWQMDMYRRAGEGRLAEILGLRHLNTTVSPG